MREQAWEKVGQNVIPRMPFKYWRQDSKDEQPYIVRAPIVKLGTLSKVEYVCMYVYRSMYKCMYVESLHQDLSICIFNVLT